MPIKRSKRRSPKYISVYCLRPFISPLKVLSLFIISQKSQFVNKKNINAVKTVEKKKKRCYTIIVFEDGSVAQSVRAHASHA